MCNSHLARRLYIQAVCCVVFPMLNLHRDGSGWLLIGLCLAAASAGLAFWVGKNDASTRNAVIGFEVVALAVGGVGLMLGHYVPGSIVGAWTLVHVFMPGTTAPSVTAPMPGAPVDASHQNFGQSVPPIVTGEAPAPAVPVMAMAAAPAPQAAAVAAAPQAAPVPAAPVPAAPPLASAPLARDILPGR